MSDYSQVQQALASGTSPADICSTCPWDRFCINPPGMTKDQVDGQMADAMAQSNAAAEAAKAQGKEAGAGALAGVLMTALTFAGKDSLGMMCPVFVVRLRSSEGRHLADGVRAQMKAWDDNKVGITG